MTVHTRPQVHVHGDVALPNWPAMASPANHSKPRTNAPGRSPPRWTLAVPVLVSSGAGVVLPNGAVKAGRPFLEAFVLLAIERETMPGSRALTGDPEGTAVAGEAVGLRIFAIGKAPCGGIDHAPRPPHARGRAPPAGPPAPGPAPGPHRQRRDRPVPDSQVARG